MLKMTSDVSSPFATLRWHDLSCPACHPRHTET